MTPAEGGGFIRLDRETGAMSICSGKEGEWACKPMPETDAATKKKLEQLENENRALRSEKGQATPSPQATAPSGDTIPPDAPRDGAKGDTIPPAPPGDLPMPTERDVDKLFDYVEGMVKKFKERIDRLEKEAKKEPATPL